MTVIRTAFEEALIAAHRAGDAGATAPELARDLGAHVDEVNEARRQSKPFAKVVEGEIVKRDGWTVWLPAWEA